MADKPKDICIGTFAGAHGVKGEARFRSFTQLPGDAVSYGPVAIGDGRRFTLKMVREAKPGLLIVRSAQIPHREAAQALAGEKAFVPREVLPAPEEDEFYHEDLVGLAAVTLDGAPYGQVKAVVNYGAGDLVELVRVPGEKAPQLIPFTRAAVPVVDFAAGRITVDPPDYMVADQPDDGVPEEEGQ